ncbi:S-adenosyl-L-methionine-dependent methyltransferase [Radiomyces spectabilis]|uniref:S-adenosyl-L-methionine-dependent methyltransferase n=1 Tax=Radiomyces spectabilis TaxID=64574 RepID=UPI00221FC7E3|nr:S-adenosyl-L-methionine-dependent methyltransferase [Radiomyces spectabilis]KAI8388905.1 S-adenosyl-L-methionine-dependent methyltransferase [Radiomyces spectabilis]
MIVDVGTGNGIWAWEMANEFPSCQVVGIDRRKPSEQISRCSNLSYIEASIFEPWPLADNSVHFIFQRNMGQDIPKEKWRFILTEMHRVLRSGGEIELLEPDLWHHNPGPVQQAFDKFFQDLCIEMSINFTFTESLQQDIQEVGFQNVQQHSLDIPIGEWPQDPELKQFGFMNKEIRKSFLKNRKPFYTSKWGFTSDKFDIVLQELMDEYDEYHGFSRFNCWTAKKVM